MTTRTWTNNGGLAVSAANLNSLEVDVQKGLDAKTAVDSLTVNEWRASTVYALNRFVLNPDGDTVKVTTAHTSTGSYDASKFGPPVGQGDLFINVKDYGAVGNGVADDTAAVVAWLAAGGSYLRDVTLRITAGLTLSGNNKTLFMDNAKILCDTADITALTVTGNNCRIRASIDGNNKANYGIKASGTGTVIEHSIIENIYSATQTARAIEVTTLGGCIIRNNILRNINSVGDATLGNNNGASRAIIVTGTAAATARSVIANNIIEGVTGEEGDAIQVLFTSGGSIYPSGRVLIQGNAISNVSRRFIKIQASDCDVVDNTLRHDGTVPVSPGNSIDIIQSEYVNVLGNTIDKNPLVLPISVVGASGFVTRGIVVADNMIRQDDAKNNFGVYFNYVTESTVRDNTFYGGSSALSIGNCTNILIQNNAHYGGITSATSFNANSGNTGIVMRLNVNMEAGRATTATNSGTGALTEYNVKRP